MAEPEFFAYESPIAQPIIDEMVDLTMACFGELPYADFLDRWINRPLSACRQR
jgi:hypothetical protein